MVQSSPERSLEFSKTLKAHTTDIPGLVWFDLPVHGDNRGWFKENWQREKMIAAGLPDFGPIQNNMSYNEKLGTTRGIHAEPWDKYVSVGTGRVFGAWVDLRVGETFGKTFTIELDPTKAIFVPRGVGNAFQVLEDQTLYSYLVNDHWSADNKDYAFLNLADKTIAINWPISLEQAELSEKDKVAPSLADVTPIAPRKVLIIGAFGQLGRALAVEFPDAEQVDRDTFDMADPSVLTAREWRHYDLILNAAAYTAVDLAETPEGHIDAWKSNATALGYLARISNDYGVKVVHVSTDYVFDGTHPLHKENEPFSPLSVYGQTKAAGDVAISSATRHYIFRTSWVIGDGKNFVLTMKGLADKGVKPSVVNDQIGRLTFTKDLAAGIKHVVTSNAPYGIYNLTNDGKPASWADVAKLVYEYCGKSPNDITGVSTTDYYQGKEGIAPRPLQSTLNLDKIKATGFTPREWQQALHNYLDQQ